MFIDFPATHLPVRLDYTNGLTHGSVDTEVGVQKNTGGSETFLQLTQNVDIDP